MKRIIALVLCAVLLLSAVSCVDKVGEKQDIEIKETETITEALENEIAKQIEEVSEQVAEEVAEVKAQETELMTKIDENPESAKEIIENEVERVDEALNALNEKIEKISDEMNKNKVIFTTTTWNGWGYNG